MEKLKKASGQFVRFAVVGVIATIINYAVFYVLLTAGDWHYQLASASGFLAGLAAGYPLNKSWTYKHEGTVSAHKKAGYISVYLASLALSLAFLYVAVDIVGLDARIANVLAIGITTCTNFIGTKFLVFRM